MLVIKSLMTNGPNATEASKAAAEKILIDNKDTAVIITDKEKYPNAVKKLKSACSNDEILKILGYCKLIDEHNGQYPIKKLEINKMRGRINGSIKRSKRKSIITTYL